MLDPLRILIVDDDADMAVTLGDILEANGYQVDIAPDGPQALARLQRQPYDVIFLDIRMPQMSGVEVLREARLLGPETLVVMMTAYAVPERVKEAEQEGALAVLAKPLPVERVVRFLEELARTMPVLIVEDDPSFAGSLQDVLEAHGYTVAYAADAAGALEVAGRFHPDVVLLDLKLPVGNGYEVLRSLQQLDPSAAVFLMTGFGHELKGLVDLSLRDGARFCFRKPFDPDDLLRRVARVRVERAACQLGGPEGYV